MTPSIHVYIADLNDEVGDDRLSAIRKIQRTTIEYYNENNKKSSPNSVLVDYT